MSQEAFEKYAPYIKKFIYKKQWTELREVQVEASNIIMDTDNNVIIASGTASGKTEAAFFPILSLLYKKPSKTMGILYLSPLKALINDQFERLSELFKESDITVWPWHGDVSQAIKEKALKSAQGIIQMTPESLEAMLLKHPRDAEKIFSDLRFIIIDEMHSMMGEDRGLQVLCLIARLEKIASCNPRRVGLSATLNDYNLAKEFIGAGSRRKTESVGIRSYERNISLGVESFMIPNDVSKKELSYKQYYKFIYDICYPNKCLIFTNSKKIAEEIILELKTIAQNRTDYVECYIHHGSLTAQLRKEVEHAIKNNNIPMIVAATTTLELGIDIGDLDLIIQIGTPKSCSSFVQRLGRSGRRTGKSKMMFIDKFEENEQCTFGINSWNMLCTIAIIQLYVEERWIESYEVKNKPYSLLAHQTLSVLMSYQELTLPELAQNVMLLPVFKNIITIEEYRILLKYMLEKEYIQQLENGSIIVGLVGERLVNHYTFYSVFNENQGYHIIFANEEIGTIRPLLLPKVNECFALAGKSWKVVSYDLKHNKIYVMPANAKRILGWVGDGYSLHNRVAERMKKILEEDKIYEYLNSNAIRELKIMRENSSKNLILSKGIMAEEDNVFVLCTWVGTKIKNTLINLFENGLKEQFKVIEVKSQLPSTFVKIISELTKEEFINNLKKIRIDVNDPKVVLGNKDAPCVDKYDYMVPQELLKRAYLYNQMDVPNAIKVLKELV